MVKKGTNTYHEIISQPEVWEKTIKQFATMDTTTWPKGQDFEHILLIGCGSTYYLSIWGARAIQEIKRWFSYPLPASELLISQDNWFLSDKSNLALAISRSGTTSETVAAVKQFGEFDRSESFSITCYPDSELTKFTDKSIGLHYAQEKSIAQTRSFTAMMLGVSFFAERIIPAGLPEDLPIKLKDLFDRKSNMIVDLGRDTGINRLFFLGSGSRYGLACEAMLKMKEMSISYSEAYHFMEFRHGPMSMVDENSLIVGLLGKEDPHLELHVLKDMKNLGAQILAIGQPHHINSQSWIDHIIPIDFSGLGIYGDVLYLPLLQLMAYERSISKGLNPDHPTNLTSVVFLDV